ncbi:hypothetical protein PoB_005060800 [Plakobranchus ocellatus]|uniref:Uncharacterized protein n=1 Tax=Plakobranchus ocellatus TaxID=259542 RepID=A0AAV4BZ88_9GAST|nr:hypothetical protein PoB_005060800 [Plakobranchus ocellatus]
MACFGEQESSVGYDELHHAGRSKEGKRFPFAYLERNDRRLKRDEIKDSGYEGVVVCKGLIERSHLSERLLKHMELRALPIPTIPQQNPKKVIKDGVTSPAVKQARTCDRNLKVISYTKGKPTLGATKLAIADKTDGV